MSNKLDEYIKSLLEDDNNLQNEVENLLNNTESNYNNCSYNVKELIITPTTTGLTFLANYNFVNIINMLIPDLFLECTTASYNDDAERLIYLPKVCPIISYKTPKTEESINNVKRIYESINIQLNIQRTIETELIASFLYFNFTSDYRTGNSQFTRLFSLEERVQEYLLNKPSNNSSKYTEPQVIFAEIYSSDSLLIQIINFSNKLNEVLNYNKNGLNICQYFIPWLFTYNCLQYNNGTSSNFYPYTSYNTNKSLYAMEYSDLFYLSNMNNSSSNSINVLLETLYKYTNDLNLIKLVKVSNIFTIIQIALDVYNNILMQISYILSNKIYVTSAYQNPINLFKCLNLYYNYVKNEIFLNNQPNSSNSNINIKDENTLLYLEKLIANFNK